jgi:hypothetical protein
LVGDLHMNEKPNYMAANNDDSLAAIAWLRSVLASIVDVAPLSPWIKQDTQRCIRRLPNWIIVAWAKALNFDHMTAYRACPDLAETVRSDAGRQIVKQYMETHHPVPLANTMHQLAQKVLKLSRTGRLPASADTIEQQVCALAMANCTLQGEGFIQQVNPILCETAQSNHPLIEYQVLLGSKQKQKLKDIDALLSRHPYNRWVSERIVEIKRWLGLEPPTFHVRYAERTPLWDSFWNNILTGGGYE